MLSSFSRRVYRHLTFPRTSSHSRLQPARFIHQQLFKPVRTIHTTPFIMSESAVKPSQETLPAEQVNPPAPAPAASAESGAATPASNGAPAEGDGVVELSKNAGP